MKIRFLPLLSLTLALGLSSANAGDRSFGDGLPAFLRHFDTNDDGVIDEEERQAVKAARQARHEEWIAQWDADGDGEVSGDEIDAVRQSIRDRIEATRTERFNTLAGDDGLLSLDEFSAIPGLSWLSDERVQALFDRMNTDPSDDVTLEEFNARLRHHRRPGGEGEGDGEELPERPQFPNWRDLIEQLRDRLHRHHGGDGGDGGDAGGE